MPDTVFTDLRPTTRADGLQVLAARIDPGRLSSRAATLLSAIRDRHSVNELVLTRDAPVFATVPYEARIVAAELGSPDGYLAGMKALPRTPTVLDIGAHIGLFSVDVLKRCPDARIIAVEPFSPSYRALVRNLALHRGTIVPIAVRAAVAGSAGSATIGGCRGAGMLSSTSSSASTAPQETRAALSRSLPRILRRGTWPGELTERAVADELDWLFALARESVARTTVSNLIDDYDVERVSLLKIDVEGAEGQVLAGIEARHWGLVDAVAIEVAGPQVPQVTATLLRHGLLPAVRKTTFTTATFGRDSFLVRAERASAPAGPSRAQPRTDHAALAELAGVFEDLERTGRQSFPFGRFLVDLSLDDAAPVSRPWLERSLPLALADGVSWARCLLDTYHGAELTEVFGGDWTTAGDLLERFPAGEVVASRLAARLVIALAIQASLRRRSGPVGQR